MTESSSASRAILVAAADGERRRIERALHDGVQQDLIAVSVRLQLARRLTGTDLPAAIGLLDEIGEDVRAAIGRAQALADEIYPSVLEARGLLEALRGVASATDVAVTFDAAELGRYLEAVEAAVYFCCRAALEAANATGAGPCIAIRIREKEHALVLTVECDSCSIDGAAPGLVPARERIEVLGGSLAVDPADAAVRVTATVPFS